MPNKIKYFFFNQFQFIFWQNNSNGKNMKLKNVLKKNEKNIRKNIKEDLKINSFDVLKNRKVIIFYPFQKIFHLVFDCGKKTWKPRGLFQREKKALVNTL